MSITMTSHSVTALSSNIAAIETPGGNVLKWRRPS
jgi:hypothetical protein